MKCRVAVIGLGKLGLPCAEVFAQHHDVVGYDVAARTSQSVRVVASMEAAVADRDIIFIAAPTPHEPAYDGSRPIAQLPPKDFDYRIVEDITASVNRFARSSQLVVLISTVLPGTVRSRIAPRLTNARFVYNPYLIAMGSVKWDLVHPEMMIIGTEDGSLTGDAARLRSFYESFVKSDKYAIGTWDEAESIKIFYNTFISMKIGIVNMIQDVAEANGNIDVDVVCAALKMADQRITGPRYMTAGMGDGGPCHPRDNIALRFLSQRLDLGYDIFSMLMTSREKQAQNIANLLIELADKRALPIVIFGKSYKPRVEFTDGSYSVLIGSLIEASGSPVEFVDPNTGDRRDSSGPAVVLLAHDASVSYTDASGLAGGDSLYATIPSGSVVVDPWRKFRGGEGIEVIHFGNTRHRAIGAVRKRP